MSLGLRLLGLVLGNSGGGGGGGPVATFTASQLSYANQIFQRDTLTGGGQGKGQGAVAIPVVVTAAGAIYARRRSAADGTTIVQAPWLVSASVPTSTTSLSVTGVDAVAFTNPTTPTATQDGWFYLDLSADQSTWQNGTTPLLMGDLTCLAGGQSLQVRKINTQGQGSDTPASLGLTISDYGRIFAWYGETYSYKPTIATMPWLKPVSGTYNTAGNYYNTPYIVEYINQYMTNEGVACGIIGYAIGATSIATWFPGTNYTDFTSIVTAAGLKWRNTDFMGGHSDSTYGQTGTGYQLALTQWLITQVDALNQAPSGIRRRWLASYPISNSTLFGSVYTEPVIRIAGKAWAAANTSLYLDATDVQTADGTHESSLGGYQMARDFARMIWSDNVGPKAVSATRSGTTITVTLTNSGTDLVLTGSTQNRVKVFNGGSRYSIWPVSSVVKNSATQITVNLANDPGDGNAVDLYMGLLVNDVTDGSAAIIRDDRTSTGIAYGRPFIATDTPIQIAAPVPAGAVNTPPGGIVTPTSRYNVTFGGSSYTASEVLVGFGTALNGQTSCTGSPIPACGMFTEEIFFQHATVSSTSVLMGASSGVWVGVNAAQKILAQSPAGTQFTGTTVLTVGHVYWVAMVVGATSFRVYLYDVTAGTATREVNDTSTQPITKRFGNTTLTIRGFASSFIYPGAVFQAAYFEGERYTGATATAPASPYNGSETNIIACWPLNANGLDIVKAER